MRATSILSKIEAEGTHMTREDIRMRRLNELLKCCTQPCHDVELMVQLHNLSIIYLYVHSN